MSEPASRAANYRRRAEACGAHSRELSSDEKLAAMIEQQALIQLAQIEEWIATPAHIPSKHDYKLEPRSPKPRAPQRRKPGRKPIPKPLSG